MALFSVLGASTGALSCALPSFSRAAFPQLIFRNPQLNQTHPKPAARITSSSKRRVVSTRSATSLSVRCEQSAKQGGAAGVWLGRAAMIGFASAIAVEVSTGKGFLENFGVATPAPTLALAVSGLVVGLAVFFLLQSGSQD